MYTKKHLSQLLTYPNATFEVLVCVDGDYQWIMLSEGIIKTNTLVYDHRQVGSGTEVTAYLGTNEKTII